MKTRAPVLNGALGAIKAARADATLFLAKVPLVDGKALAVVSACRPEVNVVFLFFFFSLQLGVLL